MVTDMVVTAVMATAATATAVMDMVVMGMAVMGMAVMATATGMVTHTGIIIIGTTAIDTVTVVIGAVVGTDME